MNPCKIRIIVATALALLLCGCVTEQNKDNPIVSPDAIQLIEAESDEPQIPHYEPIWYKEVR